MPAKPLLPPAPLPGIESLTAVAYALHCRRSAPASDPSYLGPRAGPFAATLREHHDAIMAVHRWREGPAGWKAAAPWYVHVFAPQTVDTLAALVQEQRAADDARVVRPRKGKHAIIGRRVGFGTQFVAAAYRPYAGARGMIVKCRKSRFLARSYLVKLDDGREVWAQRCNLDWTPDEG